MKHYHSDVYERQDCEGADETRMIHANGLIL